MTVLRHALCGDDFHQTPVSIILAKMLKVFFCFCGRCNTGDVSYEMFVLSRMSTSTALVEWLEYSLCVY